VGPTGALDGLTIDVASTPARSLSLARGGAVPTVPGLVLDARTLAGCGLEVDACGTAATAAEVLVGTGTAGPRSILAGQTATLDLDGGSTATIAVAHAQQRSVVDIECASGPQQLGFDLEVAVVFEAAE
jgi:hypothetical protein